MSGAPGTKSEFGGRCYRWLPVRKHVLVADGPRVAKDDLARLIGSITVADPNNPGTWFPVDQAVPASAQVGGR